MASEDFPRIEAAAAQTVAGWSAARRSTISC